MAALRNIFFTDSNDLHIFQDNYAAPGPWSTNGGVLKIKAMRHRTMAIIVIATMASCCKSALKSAPITSSDAELELDRGQVQVHLGTMREVPPGRKRIEFGALLDPKAVFDQLRATRQADRTSANVQQLSAGLDITTGLAVDSSTSKQSSSQVGTTKDTTGQTNNSSSSNGTKDGVASSDTSTGTTSSVGHESSAQDTQGTDTTTNLSRPSGTTAPATKLTPAAPSASGLAASYHSLLYATAETVLAGQALESLFNVDLPPLGYRMVSIPIVLSIQPGRITRRNYTVDTEVALWARKECGFSDQRIVAVAPLGLTNFIGDSSVLANTLQLAASAGIPISAALAQAKGGFTKEELESLAQIARRPEFQVGIVDKVVGTDFQSDAVRVHFRYLGSGALDGGVYMTNMTLNAEIIMLVKADDDFGNIPDPIEYRPRCVNALGALTGNQVRSNDSAPSGIDYFARFTVLGPIRSRPGPLNNDLVVRWLYAGVHWEFRPFEQLEKTKWNAASRNYAEGNYQVVELYTYPKPATRILSLAQGPGGDLIAGLADSDIFNVWAICLRLPDGNDTIRDLIYEYKARDPQVSSVRFNKFEVPLKKDALAYAAVRPNAEGCKTVANWSVLPVRVLKPTAPEPDEKMIKLKSIQATLESDAVVVRLEYEAEVDSVKVLLNGAAAEIRKLEIKKKGGKATGGVVYAALKQKLRRDVDPDRRIYIDVYAPDYPTLSTEVRAIW